VSNNLYIARWISTGVRGTGSVLCCSSSRLHLCARIKALRYANGPCGGHSQICLKNVARCDTFNGARSCIAQNYKRQRGKVSGEIQCSQGLHIFERVKAHSDKNDRVPSFCVCCTFKTTNCSLFSRTSLSLWNLCLPPGHREFFRRACITLSWSTFLAPQANIAT
jgi:hypothetical protein